jgi:hypothetical protein
MVAFDDYSSLQNVESPHSWGGCAEYGDVLHGRSRMPALRGVRGRVRMMNAGRSTALPVSELDRLSARAVTTHRRSVEGDGTTEEPSGHHLTRPGRQRGD